MSDVMGTPDLDSSSPRPRAHGVAALVTLVSVGEIAVAVAILALPQEVALLLVDAALDERGLFVARMMGVAVLALGITWWRERGDAGRLARHAAGFIVYNIGVGALFGWAALAARQPAIPLLVCVVHLASGVVFIGLARRTAGAHAARVPGS